MDEYKPFSNPNPLTYGESAAVRKSFDRVAYRVKEFCAEKGTLLTDEQAIEGARNLIGYFELIIKIRGEQLAAGKIPPEEIEAARKRAKEMGLYDDEDKKPKRKKRQKRDKTDLNMKVDMEESL